MTSEIALRIGRAAAHIFRDSSRRHRVVIGKDTRLSGYMIESALSSGLCSMGIDVLLVGPVPTPGIAFLTRSLRADAGVVISASHNPYEDNGIKFFCAKLGRSRLVPIHSSTCAVLADYLRRREQFFGRPVSSYLFVTRCGTRLGIGHVHRTFYTLSRQTGLRAVGASKGPRLHDFRHRFAVEVLTRWYQARGEDAWRLLPVLSTYLGHVYVAGT